MKEEVSAPRKGTIEYDRIKLEERRARLIDRAKKAKDRAESNMKLATTALDKCKADLLALGVADHESVNAGGFSNALTEAGGKLQ